MRHQPAKIVGVKRARSSVAIALLSGLLTAMTFVAPTPLRAQQTSREAFKNDLSAFFDDGGRVLSAPAEFDGYNWLMTALTIGATAAAYSIDEDVRSEIRATPRDGWKIPFVAGELYGSGLVSGGLGIGLLATSSVTGDDDTRITGRMVLQSLVYSVAFTQVVKIVVGRSRPNLNEGKGAFRFMRIDPDHHSFPSGHTTAAFALSSTLSRRIGSLPASILLYAMSTLTAAERIASDKHWLSDTVLGAVIGSVIGLAVVRFEEEREREADLIMRLPDGSVSPFPEGSGGAGFVRHRPLLEYVFQF
jgi:hypothetical protein